MDHKRRAFLKLGGNIAAGLALAPLACKVMPEKRQGAVPGSEKISDFGLQLYTLREDMPKDPRGVLKQIASFGYKHVESFEGPMGMFWGMSNTEFKKYINGLGMTMHASHCDTSKNFEKKAEEAAAIEMKYLILPWEGAGKTIEDYKKFADDFNKKGEICRKHGIRFAFHNHDYSFIPENGVFPQDILMTGTDPSLVDFEMDIYWVVTAGQDPNAWLKKYKNRFRLSHIKDRTKQPVDNNSLNSVDLGTGIIDFAKVLKTAKDNGMEYFIVEQEAYLNSTPLKSVENNAWYMKKLRLS